MTHFEYLTIAPSLILSFSLARGLSNIAPAFQSQRRYGVHSAWVALLVVAHVYIFWGYWLFVRNETWTLLEFILFLIHPIGLLISASLLIPSGEVRDYRSHFSSIRTSYYGLWAVILASDPFLSWRVLDMPVVHPLNLPSALLVAAFVIAIFLPKRIVDWALIVLTGGFMLTSMAIANDLGRDNLLGID